MKKRVLLTLLAFTLAAFTFAVFTLAASMMFVSSGKTQDEKTQEALQGTWVLVESNNSFYSSSPYEYSYAFSGSNYEGKVNGNAYEKGTFAVSGGKLTLTITHLCVQGAGPETKCYSKAEYLAAGKEWSQEYSQAWTAEDDERIEEEFAPQTSIITVEGDKLTVKWDESNIEVYKKR